MEWEVKDLDGAWGLLCEQWGFEVSKKLVKQIPQQETWLVLGVRHLQSGGER